MNKSVEVAPAKYVLAGFLALAMPACAPVARTTVLSPYQWTISKPVDGSVTVKAPAGVGTPFIENIYLRAKLTNGRTIETKTKYHFTLPFEGKVGDKDNPVSPGDKIEVGTREMDYDFLLTVPSD